ncbi:hypothetical protein NLJ89_g3213 [Agrocybe chaxingu]|uniref:BTB domain-containing protein n=1 Tax=Agrocybe chaxingu TaxID=84603 RepID=A0A9W8MYK4_9AGAR|nr:hypothetical protein NLJ89_g3213 [Agrocybe chaxingu]
MQATENTRIRQREEEGGENVSTTRRTRRRTDEGTTSGPDASRNYVNDDQFFFPGGDCVVAIDGTLFKVHRFQLTREGSTFADLLTLPTETGSAPEMTEENPLVLTDDIADFRALCWALYATPVQLYTYQGEQIRTLDLLQVVCLLEIAHKYHFTAYEHWARDILIRHTDPQKCHSSKLRDNIEATWLLRFDSPGLALTTAEGLQLHQFQGKCYYKLVGNLGTIRLKGSSTTYVPYETELSSEQRAWLFQGA